MDKTLSTTENLDGDGPVPAVVTPKPQTPTSGAFVFPTTAVNIAARHRFRDDNPAAVTNSAPETITFVGGNSITFRDYGGDKFEASDVEVFTL